VDPGFSLTTTLLWPFFVVAFLFLLVRGILHPGDRLRFLALFVLISAMVLQILLTPLIIGPHHWVSLYPLPHVAIALLIREISRIRFGRIQRFAGAIIAAAIVVIVLSFNLSAAAHHHRLARDTGGYKSWSDGIYRLADLLKKDYPVRPIQLMDWGFEAQLFLLSGGKLRLYEPFWYDHADKMFQETLVQRFSELLKNRDNVFVIHSFEATKFRYAAAAFEAAITQVEVIVRENKVILDLRGNELCRVLVF